MSVCVRVCECVCFELVVSNTGKGGNQREVEIGGWGVIERGREVR